MSEILKKALFFVLFSLLLGFIVYFCLLLGLYFYSNKLFSKFLDALTIYIKNFYNIINLTFVVVFVVTIINYVLVVPDSNLVLCTLLPALSLDSSNKLNPFFVTGFSDGEASFIIKVAKNKEYVVNYQIIALFKIKVHKKDLILLKMIQNYFNGIGKIYEEGDAVTFVVSSVKEVKIIVNHFNKYPLVTQKQADFELFKKAF